MVNLSDYLGEVMQEIEKFQEDHQNYAQYAIEIENVKHAMRILQIKLAHHTSFSSI